MAIHSKLVIVDDEFLCLGSANCSNRSMGFDTSATSPSRQGNQPRHTVIAGLRNRLIGEHLGVEPSGFAEEVQRCGSLIQAINALRGGCAVWRAAVSSVRTSGVDPGQRLVDPERPMGMEEVLGTIAPVPERHRLGRRLFAGYVLVGTVGLLALLWRWMPLDDWLHASGVMTQLQAMSRSPAGSSRAGRICAGRVGRIAHHAVDRPHAAGLWTMVGNERSPARVAVERPRSLAWDEPWDAITFNDLPVAALRT